MEGIKESCIIIGHHDTEADVFSVQALEGGAVAYHEPFFYAVFEHIIGGEPGLCDPEQNEVCVRGVYPAPRHFAQCAVHAAALGEDERASRFDIAAVFEHLLSRECTDAVQRPGDLLFLHYPEKIRIAGDPVAKAHPGRGEEFGHAAEDHQIGKPFCQRHRGHGVYVWGELHIGLVDHDKNIAFSAEAEQTAQVFLHYGGGSWVVRVAEDEKVIAAFFEGTAEILHIKLKIPVLPQMIVFLRAPGEGELSGILRIGGPKDESMLRCPSLDEERDELAGAVPRQDEISRDAAVSGDGLPQ